MKKRLKSFVCMCLVAMMVFSTNTTAFAAEKVAVKKFVEQEGPNFAREAYANLSQEAKEIFDAALVNDQELLEFHREYVDPDYETPNQRSLKSYTTISTYSVRRAATDPMTILSASLAALGLSSAVVYSLKAMGAGMVAAIMDGPLPIGDILFAAAAVTVAIVLAVNWNEVSGKWDSIVSAFRTAFSASSSNVKSAFVIILSDVNAELAINPAITVNEKEKTFTVNGRKYICDEMAKYLTERETKNVQYMPAMLAEGDVWVVTMKLSNTEANFLASLNRKEIGVWATSPSYARALCKGGRFDVGETKEGHYPHFHHIKYTKFHCWFLG